jgi:hypothetical protein
MRRFILSAIVLALASAGAAAQEQWSEKRWGAIAFGPGGHAAYAINQASMGQAVESAISACGTGCTASMAFDSGCAAVAVNPDMAIGISVTRHRSRAAVRALNRCDRRAAGCEIVAQACTGRGTENQPAIHVSLSPSAPSTTPLPDRAPKSAPVFRRPATPVTVASAEE